MIKLTELNNGDLEISVTDKEEFDYELERFKDLCEDDVLHELLESGRYMGNNWFVGIYVGLTDSPTIAYGIGEEESEKAGEDVWMNTTYEKAWYYPDYMVKSFLDELVEIGKTIFTKAW